LRKVQQFREYSKRGEERRRIESMMSRCFTWFPISGLGEPEI